MYLIIVWIIMAAGQSDEHKGSDGLQMSSGPRFGETGVKNAWGARGLCCDLTFTLWRAMLLMHTVCHTLHTSYDIIRWDRADTDRS